MFFPLKCKYKFKKNTTVYINLLGYSLTELFVYRDHLPYILFCNLHFVQQQIMYSLLF